MTSPSRREFLAQLAAFTAGATLLPPLLDFDRLPAAEAGAPAVKPLLAVGRNADPAVATTAAVAALGGMKAFVKAGQTVVVKPNIGWDRSPEQAANTNPGVVKALVSLALAAGARQVKVFDRTCNDAKRCYANSGILAAVESLKDPRAECVHIDNRRFVPVKIKDAVAVEEWSFYRDALECDVYINAPVAKHHGISRLTIGLKNVMGVIGGDRGKIHQNIQQKLADLNRVVRPALTVVDCSRILLRHGPQGGKLEDVEQRDLVIASRDPVAADAYAATVHGLKPEELAWLGAARDAGLGVMDLSQVTVKEV
jgi:uncharacterized protein (DUF362 family)